VKAKNLATLMLIKNQLITIINEEESESFEKEYADRLKESYDGLEKSIAQADWEDHMRGKIKWITKKSEPEVEMPCEKCKKIVIGRHLDHGIYRFKCMYCGTQWHEKLFFGANID
jgi:hypothetical protein